MIKNTRTEKSLPDPVPDNSSDQVQRNYKELKQALANLPEDASEAIVSSNFIPKLFAALGFYLEDRVPEFLTGSGGKSVDYAARKSTQDDQFIQTQTNPYLLIEVKGKDINLCEGSRRHNQTVKQLKDYCLAPNCKTVKWGIITNSQHIQLFRKHGKIIHPASPCFELNPSNVVKIVSKIRQKIEAPIKALTVAIYNNKGGVGKTTTTTNLAAALRLEKKKVLVIDFDPHQQDLTHSLGIKVSEQGFYACMNSKQANIVEVIQPYTYRKLKIDIIPADQTFAEKTENELREDFKVYKLRQILEPLKFHYDYILIDTPPNWRFLSASAVYAADVVLIPAKQNNIYSLKNAATVIQKYIPELQRSRKDGGPIALPIFFNDVKVTEAQRIMVNNAIKSIIEQAEPEFNLHPYFYPRDTKSVTNERVFELKSHAHIANAGFEQVPAVYKSKIARDLYSDLAKEYFLQ